MIEKIGSLERAEMMLKNAKEGGVMSIMFPTRDGEFHSILVVDLEKEIEQYKAQK